MILSRRKAAGALDWTRTVMGRIGLTLKDGDVFLGESPSQKSVARLRQKVGDLMVSGNVMPWPEVRHPPPVP